MATDFGYRVAAARKSAALTQKQLAPLVGMSQSNLSELETVAYESGKTAQLAHHCGVDAYWLATGEGEMLAGQALRRAPPTTPTLDQALEVLGIELARDLPDDVREDVAELLAKLARRRGAQRHQGELLTLLQTPPGKRQGAA